MLCESESAVFMERKIQTQLNTHTQKTCRFITVLTYNLPKYCMYLLNILRLKDTLNLCCFFATFGGSRNKL